MEAARPAVPADRDVVAALARQARQEATTKRGGDLLVADFLRPEPLEQLVPDGPDADPDRTTVVGTIDGAVVGYGTLQVVHLPDGVRLGRIDELFVLPEARGVSVGEVMMDALVAFATERGCIGIDAVALPGDRETKNFFETFGLTARAIVVHRALVPTTRPPRPWDPQP